MHQLSGTIMTVGKSAATRLRHAFILFCGVVTLVASDRKASGALHPDTPTAPVAAALAGAGSDNPGDAATGQAAPVVLRSDDGRTELKLPAGWAAKTPVARGAILQAHRPAASLTAMVLRIAASGDVTDLKAAAEKRARTLEAVLQNATVSAPETQKVNGRRAARCHVVGVAHGIRLTYDVYALDTGAFVHAVIVSSGESYYESHKGELGDVVRGLSEVKPDSAGRGDRGAKD
jgi:hypothetical protein